MNAIIGIIYFIKSNDKPFLLGFLGVTFVLVLLINFSFYILFGLLIVLLLLIFFYIRCIIYPQKNIPVVKRGLLHYDYVIIAHVTKNQWTEKTSIRIFIYLVDEPHKYLYNAKYINNDTYIYKLDDTWVEKETNEETEYSNFIGMAVDNYLLTRKNNV